MQSKLLTMALAAMSALYCTDPGATQQAVLFSAIDGRVQKDGKPVAGALVLREWDFAEDKVRAGDSTTTDAQGGFKLNAVIHPYRKPRFLAQQTFVSQLIRVESKGVSWRVWAATKHDLLAGSEIAFGPSTPSNLPLKVIIDLDAPRALRGRVIGHTFFSDAKQ